MSSSTDRVPIARVGKPHGVRGGVVVSPKSDYPSRFAPGEQFGTNQDPPQTLTVRSVRSLGDRMILWFEGVEDRDAAEQLRGLSITISAAKRRPLGPDEFWPDDLVGMTAVNEAGQTLGTVMGVAFGPAQDRLIVVTDDGVSSEVPFVDELVPGVDTESGVVILSPIEGLLS